MKLRELLQQMQSIQKAIGTSQPYICGGTPRDRYLNQIEKISDVDITTGDKSIQYLAQELGADLSKKYNIMSKTFDDGHSAIHIGEFKMDFSSNFNVPNIDQILDKMGIKNPTELQKEMFSRDFSCNSLLLSLDLKVLLDPTKRGLQDMKDKKIRTCLDPAITLTTNKNRVIRAVYLASKLGFDIDDSIIEFVQKNPSSVKISTDKVMSEKLNSAFQLDPERAAYNITKMGIWNEIPITEIVQPYYIKHSKMTATKQAYFQGGGGVNKPAPKKKKYKSDPALVNQPRFKEPLYRNYDVYETPGEHSPGSGWHGMDNYKSISEFIAAKRKRMKDKYKADDSWIEDDGKVTKKNPNMKARAALLTGLVKEARMPGMGLYRALHRKFKNDKNDIDFPIDDQISSTIDHDGDLSYDPMEMGGLGNPPMNFAQTDLPLDFPEFEGYDDSDYSDDPEDFLKMLAEKYLVQHSGEGIMGGSDGFNHNEEEDIDTTDMNGFYEGFGPESLMYEDKWNI